MSATRKFVSTFERWLIFLFIGIVCMAATSLTYDKMISYGDVILPSVIPLFGSFSGVTYPLLNVAVFCGVQVIVGSIFYRQNHILYGLLSFSFMTVFLGYVGIVAGPLGEYLVAILVGCLLSGLLSLISKKMFGRFKSLIPSQNWSSKSLSLQTGTPKYWIVIYDVLIVLQFFVLVKVLYDFPISELNSNSLYSVLYIALFISLIFLRNEMQCGFYLLLAYVLGLFAYCYFNLNDFYDVAGIIYRAFWQAGKVFTMIVFLVLLTVIFNRSRIFKKHAGR